MPRPRNDRNTAERRAAILDAAVIEFGSHGYDSARARDIARRAGVSEGTVFYYFGDKAAIFRAIFATDLERNEQLRTDALAKRDAVLAIGELVAALCADLANPAAPGLVVELIRRASNDVELATTVMAADKIIADTLHELIAGGQRAGRIDRGLRAEDAAVVIQALADGAYLHADTDRDLQSGVRLAVERYLTGPSPRPSKPKPGRK